MNEEKEKNKEGKHLRCVKCNKVLAKQFSSGDFEIKCSRCDAINVIKKP